MDNAFKYAKINKIETESDYPYTAHDDSCKYSATKGKVLATGFYDVP